MTTIEAMKQALKVCIEMGRFGDVAAVEKADATNAVLRESIKREEAKTVEPVGQRINNVTLGHPIVWFKELEPGTLLFTHPAPAKPSGEREALIQRLRGCADSYTPGYIDDICKDAADILSADGCCAARERHTRETLRKVLAGIEAQQVSVPQKPTHYADDLGRLHTADRARFLGLDTDHLLWLYAAPQPPQGGTK